MPEPAEVHESDNGLYILNAPLDVKLEQDHTRATGEKDACGRGEDSAENENTFRTHVLPKVREAVNSAPHGNRATSSTSTSSPTPMASSGDAIWYGGVSATRAESIWRLVGSVPATVLTALVALTLVIVAVLVLVLRRRHRPRPTRTPGGTS